MWWDLKVQDVLAKEQKAIKKKLDLMFPFWGKKLWEALLHDTNYLKWKYIYLFRPRRLRKTSNHLIKLIPN